LVGDKGDHHGDEAGNQGAHCGHQTGRPHDSIDRAQAPGVRAEQTGRNESQRLQNHDDAAMRDVEVGDR
jgi:hypothetical protein